MFIYIMYVYTYIHYIYIKGGSKIFFGNGIAERHMAIDIVNAKSQDKGKQWEKLRGSTNCAKGPQMFRESSLQVPLPSRNKGGPENKWMGQSKTDPRISSKSPHSRVTTQP